MKKKTVGIRKKGRRVGIQSISIFAEDRTQRQKLLDMIRLAEENNAFELIEDRGTAFLKIGNRKKPLQVNYAQKEEVEFLQKFFAGGVTAQKVTGEPEHPFGGILLTAKKGETMALPFWNKLYNKIVGFFVP